MPDYVNITHISGMIPAEILVRALDEDGDGQADPAAWSHVAAEVKAEIDTILERCAAVPFENPVPALVVQAAKVMALEKLYTLANYKNREGKPFNPAASTAVLVRAQLAEVAAGKKPLYPRREDSMKPASKP